MNRVSRPSTRLDMVASGRNMGKIVFEAESYVNDVLVQSTTLLTTTSTTSSTSMREIIMLTLLMIVNMNEV